MKKKESLFYWFLFLLLFLEIVYKEFAFNTFFSLKSLYLIPFSLIYVSILTLFCSSFNKEKINRILTITISTVFTIYFIAQFVYYKFYIAMISIYSIKMGTVQAFGWTDQIMLVIFRNIFVVLLFIIPLLLYIFVIKKHLTFEKLTKMNTFKILTILFISLIISFVCIIPGKNKTYSNYNLVFKVHYPTLTVNKFGLTTTAFLDTFRFITDYHESIINLDIEENNKNYNSKKYNILNIDFDKLIKDESDENIKKLHNYFKNKIPTNKNEYTGLFKGKNLIFITAESFDSIAIDKEITPTLYKLSKSSFVFENYYVPIFPVSTLDGEYMNLTSLIPKEGVWSLYETSKNSMPLGIGNVFNNLNYTTYAYHNNDFDFYRRDLSHPNLGFNYIGCGNGLEEKMNCELWPQSDYELIKGTVDDYIYKENFMAYYMTVSGHLRYTPNNDISKKNWKYVENSDKDEELKSYLAQNIELDKGIEYLIDRLTEENLLDDTLIVIAPDHYPYGFSTKQITNYNTERKSKFGIFKSSLIIYNPTLESKNIEKITTSIDILPTIYNLFGIDYDSRLFMGNDIFSDSEGIITLADRSFKTSFLEYDALKDKVTIFNNNKDYDLEQMKNEAYYKFTISSKILELNYYEKLAKLID